MLGLFRMFRVRFFMLEWLFILLGMWEHVQRFMCWRLFGMFGLFVIVFGLFIRMHKKLQLLWFIMFWVLRVFILLYRLMLKCVQDLLELYNVMQRMQRLSEWLFIRVRK